MIPRRWIRLVLALAVVFAAGYLLGILVRYVWVYWIWRWDTLIRQWRIGSGGCLLRTGPFVQILDEGSVMVSWITSCPVSESTELIWHCNKSGGGGGGRFQAILEHRHSGANLIETVKIASKHYLSRTRLTNLPPSTRCHYRLVLVGRDQQYSQSFISPPENHQRLRVALVGDSQFGSAIFYQVARRIYKRRPDLFGHLGDMVQQGHDWLEWEQNFFDPIARHWPVCGRTPCFAIQGNHDLTAKGVHPFWILSTNGSSTAYWAFTAGPARWILLDTNQETDEQVRWLETELASPASQRASFRILLAHIPPFIHYWDPVTWGPGGESRWPLYMRNRILPVAERGRVDLLVSGHQHNYQRGFHANLHLVISGGGGGELDRVSVLNYSSDDHSDHDRSDHSINDSNHDSNHDPIYKVTRFCHHYLWLEVGRDELVLTAHALKGDTIIDQLRIPRATVRKIRP